MVGLGGASHADMQSLEHSVMVHYILQRTLCERFPESYQLVPLHVIGGILMSQEKSFHEETLYCAHHVCPQRVVDR